MLADLDHLIDKAKYSFFKAELTRPVEWGGAQAFASIMEGDSEVGTAVWHLLETEWGHIAPVFESRADGPLGPLFAQVRGVVEDAVSQASLAPGAYKRELIYSVCVHVCVCLYVCLCMHTAWMYWSIASQVIENKDKIWSFQHVNSRVELKCFKSAWHLKQDVLMQKVNIKWCGVV